MPGTIGTHEPHPAPPGGTQQGGPPHRRPLHWCPRRTPRPASSHAALCAGARGERRTQRAVAQCSRRAPGGAAQ
eukprot:4130595-Alexandrium_andersonii.AAC.1